MSVSASAICSWGALTTIELAALTAVMVTFAPPEELPRRRPQRERACDCSPVTSSWRIPARSPALANSSLNVRVVTVIEAASASILRIISTASATSVPGPRTMTLLELVSAVMLTPSVSAGAFQRRRRDEPPLRERTAETVWASVSAWALTSGTISMVVCRPLSSVSNDLMSSSARATFAGGAWRMIVFASFIVEMRTVPPPPPPRRPRRPPLGAADSVVSSTGTMSSALTYCSLNSLAFIATAADLVSFSMSGSMSSNCPSVAAMSTWFVPESASKRGSGSPVVLWPRPRRLRVLPNSRCSDRAISAALELLN